MGASKADWQVIHEKRDCFDLILIQTEAKRLSIKNVRGHRYTT